MTFSRTKGLSRGTSQMKRTVLARGRKRLRPTVDPELAAWADDVRERDGNRCQWPFCDFCGNVPNPSNDAHHKALRSARPDLRLVLSNGVTVCRLRHNWIHSSAGRGLAIAAGFLNLETYEVAAKSRNELSLETWSD